MTGSRVAKRIRLLRGAFELVGSRLPTRSRAGLVHRLVARAGAEREAQRYSTAAAFYEEALRIAPNNARVRVQCGHMHKEAGNLGDAEAHYLSALALLPDDADLALQLGHFYKVAERPRDAAQAYGRAAELRPGWTEAQEELHRVSQETAWRDAGQEPMAGIVPELLPPAERSSSGPLREGFQVNRLGATRTRGTRGDARVLRGIEAIRGFIVASTPLKEVTLSIEGEVIAREPLRPHPLERSAGQTKYVFNLWHDFSSLPVGEVQVELRVADGRGWSRTHRAILEIAPPHAPEAAATSDAIVPSTLPADEKLEAVINGLPSNVRPARRTLFEGQPKAILVQRADQLGDLACSVPALNRLRAHFPEARIVALLTPSNVDLGRTLPMIDDIVVAPFQEADADGPRTMSATAQSALRRRLAAYDFDIALDLAETAGSRPLLLLSGARFLYGFKGREFPWLTAAFEVTARDPGNNHEMASTTQKLVALVDSLATIAAPVTATERKGYPVDLLTPLGLDPQSRYVVLHTGARLPFTRWPGFASLANMLVARTDLTVMVMGEEAAGLPAHPRIKSVPGILSFETFDGLLAGALAFVGNDSGPKHLASLRGTPVISLHMARLNWSEWGQTQTGVIVSRHVPCAGCGISRHEEECGKDFACLRNIAPEEVFVALMDILGGEMS